jgi:hypothetical protein
MTTHPALRAALLDEELRLAELLDRAAEGGTTMTSYRVALPPALPAEVEGFLADRGAHGIEARAPV